MLIFKCIFADCNSYDSNKAHSQEEQNSESSLSSSLPRDETVRTRVPHRYKEKRQQLMKERENFINGEKSSAEEINICDDDKVGGTNGTSTKSYYTSDYRKTENTKWRNNKIVDNTERSSKGKCQGQGSTHFGKSSENSPGSRDNYRNYNRRNRDRDGQDPYGREGEIVILHENEMIDQMTNYLNMFIGKCSCYLQINMSYMMTVLMVVTLLENLS